MVPRFVDPLLGAVYVKQRWGDPWRYVPFLRPVGGEKSVGREMSWAEFEWEMGDVMQREAGKTWRFYRRLNISNWFVKIEAHRWNTGFDFWFGIIQPTRLALDGDFNGTQGFKAYGLEYLLGRLPLFSTYIDGGLLAMRSSTFNRRNRRGLSLTGNRSSSPYTVSNGAVIFTFSTDGAVWTARQILDYLLFFYQPLEVPFVLVGQLAVLDNIVEEVSYRGLLLIDVLNDLVTPKRGLNWRVVTTGGGVVGIEVFSHLAASVAAGGTTIPANQNGGPIWLRGYGDVSDIDLRENNLFQYDSIVVESVEPIKMCCTLDFNSAQAPSPHGLATLEPGWSSAKEAAYIAAADEDRGADELEGVYRFFRVPPAFNWTNFFPSVNDQGEVDPTGSAGFVYWNADRRFERTLPLTRIDATSNETEMREPFGVVFLADPEGGGAWHHLHQLSLKGLRPVGLRPADREQGVFLIASPNHLIAKGVFQEGGGSSGTEVEIDYRNIRLTLFVETDSHLRVVWDLSSFGFSSAAGKQIYRQVKGVEYWYAAPHTVDDVSGGALTYVNSPQATPKVLRDDSGRLRAIAGMIYALHVQQAATIGYTLDQISMVSEPGQLITFADGIRVGTVVVKKSFNFMDDQSMSIQTERAEVDPVLWIK